MNLDKAKELFEEVVEICYETENQKLIEAIEPIQREILNAEDISQVIYLAEEMQIFFNEIELLPEDEEPVLEMSQKIEKLSE